MHVYSLSLSDAGVFSENWPMYAFMLCVVVVVGLTGVGNRNSCCCASCIVSDSEGDLLLSVMKKKM